MAHSFDVIVVGGGVIGSTIAWELAKTGRNVLLLERNHIGAEASSAAAGMLGAQLEVNQPGAFSQLCLESRARYPAFVDELYEETGIDPQLTHNGIVQLAYSEDEVEALQAKMRWQVESGARAIWLSGAEAAAEEPGISECLGALLLPDDSNVNAPLLMQALARAVKRRAVVEEGAEVFAIQHCASGGYEVSTQGGRAFAPVVVAANGAWASRLLGSLGMSVEVQPVKGQLLSIRPRRARALVRTLFSRHAYLVPKRDGTIVVGATEDRAAGFNRDVTIDAIAALLAHVQRIVPVLRDAGFEQSWVGLRPGSSDGLPWIGEVPDHPGLYAAVGHFRNGMLLAPVTGAMLVHAVEHVPWPSHWEVFRARRRTSERGESAHEHLGQR
ncbi:glycine oxidase ThiO [Alicyclobacillus cycloheptanicus]|uniref:glycine oxidase n=1 Tax=Alicyclobacillus cycloheptanicus TaxID=1457 RepID=A0ABT9XJ25_9BACL|nr:glycine oxidase ThiO [Alicyclobacillus cycloheptanicus]MDQ0190319.1 glycine oxidase [Alicyclobacillus cycloheptanicus]WDM00036.1 glycine oxidase ThiO [Alicyclobacillus cycloheptanicus]